MNSEKVQFKTFLDLSPIHQKLLSTLQQMNELKILFYKKKEIQVMETQQVLQMRLRIGTDNDNLIFSRKPTIQFFLLDKKAYLKKTKK